MSVFDDIPREASGPPAQYEAAFAYLNRSARAEAGRVRQLVDSWFEHYPVNHRGALAARFRSPINEHHQSAFFELFLHELILTRGHKIIAIEPTLSHTTKSPDFLVESSNGGRFYLEAVIATGHSQQQRSAQARLNRALHAIDTTPSPAHFLDLYVRGAPTAPLSINKLKRALEKWIAGLPDDHRAEQTAPFVYEEHDMHITLRAFPRHNREQIGRTVGVRHFPVQQLTPGEDIRSALDKKASRYGTLDHPYVVAINAVGLFQGEDDTLAALLGTPCAIIRRFPDGSERVESGRESNGIWIGPRGPRKTGLSAVLSTERIDPWNFASRRARLIRNPWAVTSLPPIALSLDELNPAGGRLHRTEGVAMGQIFGLPQGWPEA